MKIDPKILALKEEATRWRRDFHENPELLYEVHRTAGIVAEKLKAFGCDEVVTGIGKTGVVGVIHGRKSSSKVVGLRADMDAAPEPPRVGSGALRRRIPALTHPGELNSTIM